MSSTVLVRFLIPLTALIVPMAVAVFGFKQEAPAMPKAAESGAYVWHSIQPAAPATTSSPAPKPTWTMMADASSAVAVNLRLCPIPADSNDAPLTDISCRRPIGGPR